MICSRCKKRQAVLQIARQDSPETSPQWLCMTCIKELNIQPFASMFDKMGITEEDLQNASAQLANMFEDENFLDNAFNIGGAATFPFTNEADGAVAQGDRDYDNGDSQSTDTKEKGKKQKEKKKKHKFLDNYCTNLTQKARDGELDPVIGREDEINRVIQILCRRTKNNPCLIGEPGVGKTAIAEGLAIRIAEKSVPARLKKKEVQLLDLAALVAGTQFRGQFESRIKSLVDEVKADGNIILFIDEVHNLVGAGEAEGAMNAANILKPALSRGEIQIIGATTFNEYRLHIEKDAALERRFQPVTVEEPSIESAYKMLLGIKSYYEKFHGVKISDSLLYKTVVLSERYISDRFLPDKAIDLLDEACTSANLRNKAADQLVELSEKLTELQEREDEMMQEENIDYEALANVRAEALSTEEQVTVLADKASGNYVTEDDIANVIQLWTGIPASKIKESDLTRLKDLETNLKKHIIGQDSAVELLSAAIRRSRVQISPYRHPASFIFVGPTGVGKTELVKQLANELFDTPETLIRLDMSEYMEKHAVAKIIGSPPGYVGYDEAGQLTEQVRRKPYSVILFDEIEKAHPDVMNILLQILDEGKITDSHGRRVDFQNTVIVMTSNAGSERREGALGFAKTASEATREKALKALSEFLRPEFLGRVDEIVVFNQLTESDYEKIAELILNEYVEPLKDKGIDLTWDRDVLEYLAKKSIDGTRGARDLRNLVRREVEDEIANMIIERGDMLEKINISLVESENGKKLQIK